MIYHNYLYTSLKEEIWREISIIIDIPFKGKQLQTFVKDSKVLISAHIHQKISFQKINLFCILTDAVHIHYEALIHDSVSSVHR